MKKIFTLSSIVVITAIVMTACNRKPDTDTASKVLSYEDTVGFAQFQSWKMQNERLNPDQYQQAVQKQAAAPVRKTASKPSNNYGSGSMNSGSQNTAKTSQKKGWSKAAKGAAIGGGAGAVAGAVINKKNRVVGGVIGGAVGAGLGYVIGRAKDKKDGRY